jgi:2-polyprenyl-3-methyl-5-hydroxy-6-metoxy-1,4-benzoquinol methylase
MTTPEHRDDWDKHWTDMHTAAGLNPAQDYRRRLLLAELRGWFARSADSIRLLDVGCGTGDFALAFQKAFSKGQYLGVDVSRIGIEICRAKVRGARFETVDLMQPSTVAAADLGWANAVICSEVLEHVDEPETILANLKPYLARNAVVLITVPGGPMSAFDRHIGHRRHFTNRELKSLLELAGFQVHAVWGAGFPFINLYRRVVIARGQKLVDDASKPNTPMSPLARLVMAAFGVLFRFNLSHSKGGWQRLAVALYEPQKMAAEAATLVMKDVAP